MLEQSARRRQSGIDVARGEQVSGWYALESSTGVRWADLNTEAGVSVHLLRPGSGVFFLTAGIHAPDTESSQTPMWLWSPN